MLSFLSLHKNALVNKLVETTIISSTPYANKVLFHAVNAFLSDENDAKDAVSETIVDAYQEICFLKKEDAFSGWIFKILNAKCAHYIKIRSADKKTLNIDDISNNIKSIDNKRYIIINRHERIDRKFFEDKLSILLKVRAMENFCAVILESENICNCYQSGKNRTAQVVEPENGFYRIDLDRTTGPEAIWKTKPGMKASWRTNAEWLIKKLSI